MVKEVDKDTETVAMEHWARLVDAGKAPRFVADATPVSDYADTPNMPKTIEAAIRSGLIHN
jgi:hypothetical protein